MTNLRQFLLIREAAEFLGISQNTLRTWAREGKIPVHRNPANGYRLFRRADLEDFLRAVEASASAKGTIRGSV